MRKPKRLCGLALVFMLLFFAMPSVGLAEDDERIMNIVNDMLGISERLGVVEITQRGYMNAYKSNNTKSGIVFRVHHGERFYCKEETDDGWYGILFIDGTIGYIPQEGTALERGVTDAQTFSSLLIESTFSIKTRRRADLYSQPKSSAQSRRESADGTTTFYFNAGEEFSSFAKTTSENKDWYMILAKGQGGVSEIFWFLATDCEVLEDDPDVAVIPGWWYD